MSDICKDGYEVKTGADAARVFKYYLQLVNPQIANPLPVQLVKAKVFYTKHQKTFDSFAAISEKYKIDAAKYFEFFVTEKKLKREKDIEEQLLSSQLIYQFAVSQQIQIQKKKIVRELKKTADWIATESIKHGYPHSLDFFRDLIVEKKLAVYYVAGKISKYFLASIPQLLQIVKKLDPISRDELMPICRMHEKYSIDVEEALKQQNLKMSSPFQLADRIISYRKQKKSAAAV